MAFRLTSSIIGILLLILKLIMTQSDWTDCPSVCRCRWTSGKKSAFCMDAELKTIPVNLSTEVQVLNLTNNKLGLLREDAFKSVGLINMQKICLKKTHLESIHENAFRDLIILVEIDLSENKLRLIHPYTFFGNDRLRVLTLNMNPLISLRAVQFPVLPHLRTLELEQCQLETIHPNAFVNLHQLNYLNLKNNRLETLSKTVTNPLKKLLTLMLSDNPWSCDCHLKEFRDWYLSKRFRTQSLTCQRPMQFLNVTWDVDVQFFCEPKVSVAESLVRTELGSNLTIICHIFGDPEPQVIWYHNDNILEIDNDKIFMAIDKINVTDQLRKISIFNITNDDVGRYSCSAKSLYGDETSANVSVILPVFLVTATTLGKSETRVYWPVYITGACFILFLCCLLVTGLVKLRTKKRKKHDLPSTDNLMTSMSFTDQNKMLIVDSSNGASVTNSLNDFENENRKTQPVYFNDFFEQPVHIIIENGSNGSDTKTNVVLPPPPEFSTAKPTAINNIFISVTLPAAPVSDLETCCQYPDLLEKISYKSIPIVASSSSSSSSAAVAAAAAAVSASTLPRPSSKIDPLPLLNHPPSNHIYDNMGPRTTANGSSIILNETHDYFNEQIPIHTFHKSNNFNYSNNNSSCSSSTTNSNKQQSILKNSNSKLEYVTL